MKKYKVETIPTVISSEIEKHLNQINDDAFSLVSISVDGYNRRTTIVYQERY